MTFLCSSCVLVAENALDASAVLSSGIAQKKSHARISQSGFAEGAERGQVTSVDIIPFVLYLNACLEVGVVSCSDWVLETNLVVFVLQHKMYYMTAEDILCCLSVEMCRRSRTQALYKHF